MVINQGDVFWGDPGAVRGSAPAGRHPFVVIQNNLFNHSRINTVILCLVTSNLSRGASPGNVRLNAGEADLDRPSVVNITQLYTEDKSYLGQKIGTLSASRVRQILDGLRLITEPRDPA